MTLHTNGDHRDRITVRLTTADEKYIIGEVVVVATPAANHLHKNGALSVAFVCRESAVVIPVGDLQGLGPSGAYTVVLQEDVSEKKETKQ